jgi:FkbM family methyltransferase
MRIALRRLRCGAPRARQLREFAALLDVGSMTDARDFSRRHGTSLWTYPDARRANLHMLPRWVNPRDGLLLDLGANEGSWTAEAISVLPDARVLAVEPGLEPGGLLVERFRDAPNVTVDLRAVSDQTGSASYYATRASVFASLLPPAPALHALYALPGAPTEVLETVDVDTIRLDDLVHEPVSVVKIDVQGGELAVLRGGQRVMRGAAAVLIEVVFVPHYSGDASFPEVDRAMADLGLHLYDISRPFRLDGRALWADTCYARADPG